MSADQSAKFWNKLAERYARHPVADAAAYQKKLQITQSYLHPDMEVLEFGCGTGSTALYHAPLVKHILAIDFSSEMIRICRDKAAAAAVNNVEFQCSSLDEFRAADASYDAVLGLNILHLLENWHEVSARVYKMLRPGGVFITSTGCVGDTIFRLFKFIAPIGRFLGLLPLLKVISQQQLEQSIQDAGFVIDCLWRPKKNAAVFIVAKKV